MNKYYVWLLFWLGLAIAVLPVLSWLGFIRKKREGEKIGARFIPDDALVELVKKLPWVSALGLVLIAYSFWLCSLLKSCFP